jgi:hypothetical protein
MHTSFLNTGIIDLLESDPRPSFIVTLTPHPPTIVYANPALTGLTGLLDVVTAKKENNAGLWEWITGTTAKGSAPRPSFSHANIFWTRTVVHEQMVVVGANEQAVPTNRPRKVRLEVGDAQPGQDGSVSPRIVAIHDNGESGTAANSMALGLSPDVPGLRRAKSTPSGGPTDPLQSPMPGPEAIRPLSRSTSDPGWVLPDMSPGTVPRHLDVGSLSAC